MKDAHQLTRRARRFLAESMLRPYIYQEFPGWGRLYGRFVGGYTSDLDWADAGSRRVRGKLHGYVMDLDIAKWSQRSTYFLGRYYDLPTQLLCQAALRVGDHVVDVGANIGMISLLASAIVGPTGRVDAFEPNPLCAQKIRQTLSRHFEPEVCSPTRCIGCCLRRVVLCG